MIVGGLIIISSNEMYEWKESGFYLEKIRATIKSYEEQGKWKIESHKYIPHLGQLRGSTTTVRVNKN